MSRLFPLPVAPAPVARRRVLALAAGAAASVAGPLAAQAPRAAHVIVVGAGFGGLTAARQLRQLDGQLRITVIEPAAEFLLCPMSIRVIQGTMALKDIARGYDGFATRFRLGWIRDAVSAIDPVARTVTVKGERIGYDRLILSPGVDFVYDGIPGLQGEAAQQRVPHAWRAGPQTLQLRAMLGAMRPGGVVALHIPKGPMRGRAAPYERAALIAESLRARNPSAKVLVFEAGAEPPFPKGLIQSQWLAHQGRMIEYVPNAELEQVDTDSLTVTLKGGARYTVDVLNVIPPQRAGALARTHGLANAAGDQWCGANFLTYESTAQPHIHIIGDALAGAPGMAKSGQLANQEAKVCAAAIVAQLQGQAVNPAPVLISAAYLYMSSNRALQSAGVFRYDGKSKTMVLVKEASGSATEATLDSGLYGMSWASNIAKDMMD